MRQLILCFCFLFCWLGEYSQTKTGVLHLKDVELHYKIFGRKGSPLLLINGGPGFSCNYLDDVALELAKSKKFRVITFDQRGTGASPVKSMTKDCVNISNTIDDIESLRDSLQVKKWSILGHAYGGALAMMYASQHPKNVDRLVLSSSIGLNLDFVAPMMANLKLRLDARQQEELNEMNQQEVKGKVRDKNFYKQRFDLIADAYVYDKSMIERARQMHQQPNDFVIEVNQIIWDELQMKEYNITEDMKKYKGKVLILHGRQDVIGESVPIFTHMALPKSTLVFINKAGRYLWLDQPDDYFRHIFAFLD